MKRRSEFELAWQGLKPGVHQFDYHVAKDFFDEHGDQLADVEVIEADINLKFEKHETFFELHFDIDGYLITPCDRCGEPFKMLLWDEFDLIIKLTDEEFSSDDQEDADIVFIPRSETVLDISKWLYEFVILSIPLQKVHPNNIDGSSGCNSEMLKLIDKFAQQSEQKENNIWKDLASLQLNKKNNNKHKK